MIATPGPQPDELFRRLRAWGISSWEHGDRAAHLRAALTALAELGDGPTVVPALGPWAFADQLEVLYREAAERDEAAARQVLAALAAALGWDREG